MTKQRNILIMEILICLLIPLGMAVVSHYVYADVYRLTFLVSLLVCWAVITIINWKKEVDTEEPRIRWFTVVLVVGAIGVFLIFRPALTYEEGKDLLSSNGYTNISELEEKSLLSFTLRRTDLIDSAYLYIGERNGTKYYCLVSPLGGSIEVFPVGEGNYIDMYFDLIN